MCLYYKAHRSDTLSSTSRRGLHMHAAQSKTELLLAVGLELCLGRLLLACKGVGRRRLALSPLLLVAYNMQLIGLGAGAQGS